MKRMIKIIVLCLFGGVIGLTVNIFILQLQEISVVFSLIGFFAIFFITLAYFQIRKPNIDEYVDRERY